MRVCRDFTFDAAHHLTQYRGKCEHIHGHTYKLRVCIEEEIKDNGLAYDFVDLKRIVNEFIIDVLDHSDLNDRFEQPSAELIAVWIWNELSDKLNMAEITLWESPDCFIVYKGE